MNDAEQRFLTTREVADLLRMRERRVYDLAAAGEIPCRRITGRLLFPRSEIEAWIGGPAEESRRDPAPVVAGSHDPLLERALRASGCGLASFFDGSLDGLDRLAAKQAAAVGCHVPETDGWNLSAVRARLGDAPVVLMEWARREVGLLVAPDLSDTITTLTDLTGRRVALRQPRSGSQLLFELMLDRSGMTPDDVQALDTVARTEAEAAAAVAGGLADAAPGLAAMAREYRLEFLPLAWERFDLCIDRRFHFEPAWQRFLAFCHSPDLAAQASALGGYDLSGQGTVHWNGP